MAIAPKDIFDRAWKAYGQSVGDSANVASGAFGSLADGIGAASTAYTVLRKVGLPVALGLLSMARKRGLPGTLVLLGTGAAIGAGAAVLLTPMTGEEMRRALLERIKGVTGEAKQTIVTAEHKVEEIASKAKDSVIDVEHKIEHKVHDLVDEVKAVFESSGHYTELRRAGSQDGKSNGKGNHASAGTAVN